MDEALAGRRVIVPETREIEVLASLLERRGATVLRCPLVTIRDAEDPAPVADWIDRVIANPPDDVILFTGEGLERLYRRAGERGVAEPLVAALAQARKITRGPKPARRLRGLGLTPDLAAEPPTTAGIIATLSAQNLSGRRIAVQLYPDAPHNELLDFLRRAEATVDAVTPYAYATAADDDRVAAAIDELAAGRIDLIAFTSSPQLRRLQQVAKARGCEAALSEGLTRTPIAAVGPVVATALREAGFSAAIAPEASFHMRPMVNAIVAALGKAGSE